MAYTISGHVNWDDEENKTVREADPNRGSLYLWRYAENEPQKSAQAASQPLAESGENDTVIAHDDFSFDNYPKYDINGNRYTYYVKENLNSTNYKYYKRIYNDSNGIIQTTMPDGGTIINRLSDGIIFTVNAKWIAAARQGGSASATYTIQRQKSDGSWEPALDVDGNAVIPLSIPNFGAETMELTKEFTQAVPMYDDKGKKIEYRIVQTTVSRTDEGFTGTYGEVDTTNTTITLHNDTQNKDGDQYEITITPPAANDKTNTWSFKYKLTGNYDIYIQKIWEDTNNPNHSEEHPVTHADETIHVELKQGSFTDTTYSPYRSVDVTITDTDYNNTKWTKIQNVPIYDEEGHEYYYKIEETTSLPNYYRTYSYDKVNKVYKVKNTYSSEAHHYIKIQKEWQNDGELEYKKELNVQADTNVFQDTNNDVIKTNGQSVVVNDQNLWYNEVYRNVDYSFDTNDFSENAGNRNTSKYLNLNAINADNRVPSTVTEEGKKWIYLFDETCPATVGENVIDVKDLIGNNTVFLITNILRVSIKKTTLTIMQLRCTILIL